MWIRSQIETSRRIKHFLSLLFAGLKTKKLSDFAETDENKKRDDSNETSIYPRQADISISNFHNQLIIVIKYHTFIIMDILARWVM